MFSNGPLTATFTADGPPAACAPGKIRLFVDGKELGSDVVQPGQTVGGKQFTVSNGYKSYLINWTPMLRRRLSLSLAHPYRVAPSSFSPAPLTRRPRPTSRL